MIAGIVLSAGRSTRMGQPKALLRLEGRTFLDRAIDVLRSGGCAEVHAVVGLDAEVREAARASGAALVVNDATDSEQIDSLRLGISALAESTEAALVLPVDVPGVEGEVVRSLIETYRRTRAPIVIPTAGGRHGHPVLFSRPIWDELFAVDLPEGARTVVHRHEDRVEVPVDVLPADVDTPADYRRLLEETG